jgi:hypothetical protein
LLLPPSGSVSSAIPDFNCGDNRARWEFKEFECGHGFYRKIERLEHRAAAMVVCFDPATLALIVSISSAKSDEQTPAKIAQRNLSVRSLKREVPTIAKDCRPP